MPKTFKDEVEAIFLNFLAGVKQNFRQDELEKAITAILAAADKLIGEDENGPNPGPAHEKLWRIRNQLRAELRERLGK